MPRRQDEEHRGCSPSIAERAYSMFRQAREPEAKKDTADHLQPALP